RAAGDALGLQGAQELVARQAAEVCRVVAEDEEMVGVAGDARGALQRRGARGRLQGPPPGRGVFLSARGRFGPVAHLGVEDRALPFGHAVVAAEEAVLVPASLADAAAVDQRPGAVVEALVVGEDDPALAGVQVLARLEAEGAGQPDRADTPLAPLGAV